MFTSLIYFDNYIDERCPKTLSMIEFEFNAAKEKDKALLDLNKAYKREADAITASASLAEKQRIRKEPVPVRRPRSAFAVYEPCSDCGKMQLTDFGEIKRCPRKAKTQLK